MMAAWRTVPGPEDFDARIAQLVDDDERSAWFMFLRPRGSVYWLCGGAVEGALPYEVELDEQKRAGTVKLCALLGLTWEEIEAKPAESAAWQLECMRKLGPNMRAKLRGSTVEEIAEWREQMHTLEPGEVLREQLTGEDPLAGRN